VHLQGLPFQTLNPDGRIAKIYPNVDPLIHSAEVINDLKMLKGK
jgi:peroxiredoxin